TDPTQAASYLQQGNEIFISVVVVSLVTTIIVPLLFNGLFFRKDRKKEPKGVCSTTPPESVKT
ncbi:MAG TPA: hypothetical protein O0Y08_05650, partial [Methanocorpusculum sp.]|nr:hypothetical protein [Methanocorpusculum sp.]